MSEPTEIPICCGTCRYREMGTCRCINWRSPNKEHFMMPAAKCDQWTAKKKHIARKGMDKTNRRNEL